MKYRSSILSYMKLEKMFIAIALAILAMLTACDRNDEGEVTWEKILELEVAAARYKADCNQFPGKAEDLSKDPGVKGWRGPYSAGILDSWGVPFQLNTVEGQLEIRSYGPDRIKNTEDDIIN